MSQLELLVRQARQKRDTDLRPSLLEQKAESLDAALFEVKGLATGETIKVVPPPQGEVWFSPY